MIHNSKISSHLDLPPSLVFNVLFSSLNFCVGDIKHIKTTENKLDLECILRTSVSVLGLSIKLKPAVLLNSGEFWGETADQNRGGFEHMQMTQSLILSRHESLCVRFLRYSDRKLTNGTVIWKDNRLIVPVIRFKGFSFRSTS